MEDFVCLFIGLVFCDRMMAFIYFNWTGCEPRFIYLFIVMETIKAMDGESSR
jgi:hypothetical protein